MADHTTATSTTTTTTTTTGPGRRVELTVEGPAAFAGALVDALSRRGVEVVAVGEPPLARTLDAEHVVTVPVTVVGTGADIDGAVTEFIEQFPEAVVREANAGLG
jgi:hypothetical protein